MEKQLSYPLSNLTKDQLVIIAKKIEIRNEDNSVKFYINDKLLEDDKLCIGMISYIKLIELFMNGNKDINELNTTIHKITDDVVTRILDLKDAGANVLLEKLQLEDSVITINLLKNIIEAYEIDYGVKKSNDPKRYQPVREKTNDSISMQTEKILSLIKTV